MESEVRRNMKEVTYSFVLCVRNLNSSHFIAQKLKSDVNSLKPSTSIRVFPKTVAISSSEATISESRLDVLRQCVFLTLLLTS